MNNTVTSSSAANATVSSLSATTTLTSASATQRNPGSPRQQQQQAQSPAASPRSPGRKEKEGGEGAGTSTNGKAGTAAATTTTATEQRRVVLNDHFLRPRPPPQMPWEMSIDQRRDVSKDPRVIKQVQDERQWDDTIIEGIWNKLVRKYAVPSKDWFLDLETLQLMLVEVNIQSTTMLNKIAQVVDFKNQKRGYNALVLCKLIQLGVLNNDTQDTFIRHCFNKFDRPAQSECINQDMVSRAELENPAELKKKGAKKKGGKKLPFTMKAGANYGMVKGLLNAFALVKLQNPTQMSYGEFKAAFLDPEYHVAWIPHFMGPLLECVASVFAPPHGKLPYISLRWLKTTEPMEQPAEMYDADIVLLREVEQLGFDPFTVNAKKKGGKGGASPAGKKTK